MPQRAVTAVPAARLVKRQGRSFQLGTGKEGERGRVGGREGERYFEGGGRGEGRMKEERGEREKRG